MTIFKKLALGVMFSLIVLSIGFSQQQSAITAEKITDNIYIVKGGVANTGLVKTLKALLELKADRYVPGHGNIATKSDIEAEMKSLQEKQDKVRLLIKEGKSLEEIKAAFGIPTAPAKPGGFSFPSIVEVMYLELAAK